MKKKILPFLLLFVTAHVAHAVPADDTYPAVLDIQEPEPDTYLPIVENYFSSTLEPLKVDYLYNIDSKVHPSFHSMKKFDWGSLFRTNGAFLYAIRLNQSRFAFCAGIGWSTLHYVFAGQNRDGVMVYLKLKRDSKSRVTCEDIDHDKNKEVSRSAINIPFFDVLCRLRFNSVLDNPKEGVHLWLGGKLGFRQRPSTIIHYKEYDDSGASCIENGYFNLKRLAWALQAGVGYGRFGLTGAFYLTPLFEKNQGPDHSDQLRPFSFSMYVDLL